MTVTIHLPPEKEAVLQAQARAQSLSLEEWLLQIAERAAEPPPSRNLADVCALVKGLADDLDFTRNPSAGRIPER